MRTGNPDILKAEAKKCGSHYFDKSTMRFFASRLSPELHPSEKGEDVTYFVTSEKFESQRLGDGPRRYSVHRFKNCRIDTVGQFQAYRTGGAAHTAARRLARGVDSDGLSGFLPTSGVGKLVLFGGLGLAAGATALYFIRRSGGAPAPGGATRKPTPAASVPQVLAPGVMPPPGTPMRQFSRDLGMLLNLAVHISRPYTERRDPKTEADYRKTISDIARENAMPKTAAVAMSATPGFGDNVWPHDELWPGTRVSVNYYVRNAVLKADGSKTYDPVVDGAGGQTLAGTFGAPVGIYDDPGVFAAPAMAFEPAYEVMH